MASSVTSKPWLSYYSEAVETTSVVKDKRKYTTYKAKKLTSGIVYSFYNQMVTKIFDEVVVKVKEASTFAKLTSATVIGEPMKKDTLDQRIHELSNSGLQDIEREEKKDNKIKEKLNSSAREMKACALLAKGWVTKFFTSNPLPSFTYPTSEKAVSNWKTDMQRKASSFIYNSLGLKESPAVFSYSQDILDTFGIPSDEKVANPETLSCAEYALLFVKELNAKDYIFKGKDGDGLIKNIFEHLRKWKYMVVTDPQPGDLAVYMTNDEAPTHVGVVSENHFVHSKLGIANPYTYHHRLFDLPDHYGRNVVFFRKRTEE